MSEKAPKKRKGFVLGHYPGMNLWTVFFFFYLYLPMVVLVVYSFNDGNRAQIWQGFSTRWFYRAFINDDIQNAALNSLIIAVCATVVATVLATLAALVLARGGQFRGKSASLGLITLPLIVPEIATAVATLSFFAIIGFQLGMLSIIIAHTVFCIPFAFLPIRARLEGMDTTLEQAAGDLYANSWETFRFVTLPILAPGIVAGAMLAFIISVDDFIITLMVSGAGATTLPLYIYGMIRQGITPEVNVISTVMLAISVAFISAYWFISAKGDAVKTH